MAHAGCMLPDTVSPCPQHKSLPPAMCCIKVHSVAKTVPHWNGSGLMVCDVYNQSWRQCWMLLYCDGGQLDTALNAHQLVW
jgi:hypothetical protein